MNKLFPVTAILLLIGFSVAQAQSNLTVFSEDGLKFFLILNGQRQNDVPQTNLRINGLPQPYYSCKIIFDDKSQGEINKKFLGLVDGTNQPMDVTYKIKKNSKGENILRFFSEQPMPVNPPPPPADVVVFQYGQPATPVVATTVTQTTTTQSGGVGTNVGMNVGGVGINVNVNDPTIGSNTTTTTTTTYSETRSTNNNPNTQVIREVPPPPSGCNGYPMNPGDYGSAKESINNASFEDTKLSTAKQIAGANCLYADQVAEICRLFSFENSKLAFAKFAYNRTIDRQNYFKVNNVFDFDASKTELSKFTAH